ncbi:hypothetical protein Agabi119p4_1288 [Agaricus bisporus var. burnettii]|uniref:Reverse transcriptase Ty1/copia-type domain-containing protein n=1 Tax=Agaricus bisporus var. burnettii TaxID=192524 RepID=A0A8H7KLJ9_AGABI|nr:hypothetical protein Agabi119p4_1288 [Agaricus bisporus var. burnettii]
MCSVNISSAFTYGELEEEIYMRQPEGYHIGSPNMVFRLRKSLYGLKQAARQWNKKLRSVLEGIGYSRLRSHSSIYIYSKGDIKVIVPIFIDDITLVSKSNAAMTLAVTELSKHFKLRDLGSTTLLLEHFNMGDANPLSTPLAPGSELSDIFPSLEEQAEMKSVPYLNAVGALQYLATMTRPDIAYAVSYLGRFNSNPAPAHWLAVKHLFRYLIGTMHYKLVYRASDSEELFTYSDASHGACKATGRATGGYVTLVSGAAVGWSSKRQPFVTLSSTEAEFVAAVEAGKEIKWTRNILTEFGFPLTLPSTLFVDNKSGISVAKNPEHHGRMKHLDLRFYWLWEAVEEGLIDPLYVSTHEQVADILTKAVAKKVVEFAVPLLGLE